MNLPPWISIIDSNKSIITNLLLENIKKSPLVQVESGKQKAENSPKASFWPELAPLDDLSSN